MLTELKLYNFRGFQSHILPLRPLSILVGRNNAGKSSLVEALRLVSIVTSRYKNLSYHQPPKWLDIPKNLYGASIDLRNMQIDYDTICYSYKDPPATIIAKFSNNNEVRLYLGNLNQVHAVIIGSNGKPAKTRSDAKKINLYSVSIMPQIGPLAREEKILSNDHVRSSIDSPLSSLHFRNQLRIYREYFSDFSDLSEETWPGFKIDSITCGRCYPGDPIFLNVRNEEFVGEVSRMGHGLQMWMQTMWFLTRSIDSHTIILDEPDVYMHADLQRRLISYLKMQEKQVIIATHSIEIISEVEPDQILIIERKNDKSNFADSIPAVQRIIESVGSAHNLHLSKLVDAKKVLILEGEDFKLLRILYESIFPRSQSAFSSIPNWSIGGWGGWNLAIGSSITLQNAFGEIITTYCIFDRDFHSKDEIEKRYEQALERGVELHIWGKKELENYLLNSTAITRFISSRVPDADINISLINKILLEIAEDLRYETIDAIADSIHTCNRSLGVVGANRKARHDFKNREKHEGTIIDIVSGKAVLSKISAWSQKEYAVSISAVGLAHELLGNEISDEMKLVLRAINEGERFINSDVR